MKILAQYNRQEDKQAFLNKLCELLQATREYDDLQALEYMEDDGHEEYALVYFGTVPSKKICITGDSEWGILKDVIQHLPR